VEATVTDLVFQGPVVRYELRLADGHGVIAHIAARRDGLPIPGDTVWAAWPPEASVLLPPAADGSSTSPDGPVDVIEAEAAALIDVPEPTP